MPTRSRSFVAVLLVALAAVSTASAHYLWVTIDAKAGKAGRTNVYFEGGPAAGNGEYLDRFVKRGKTWIRTIDSPKPKLLRIEDVKKSGKRWLAADLPAAAPRSIDSYGLFGVYKYGEKHVLLHYYGRNLQVNDHDELHELGRAEQMTLDIVPHESEKGVQLEVIWKGKGSANRTVYVRGPKGFKKNLKTDAEGKALFQPAEKGRYTLRTLVIEPNKKGKFDGMEYVEVRHNATMILQLPF